MRSSSSVPVRRSARGARALACALVLLSAAGARAQDPVAGDVGKIAARVRNAMPQQRLGSTLIEVEVTNRERFAFEPTLFAVRWSDAQGTARSAEIARVPLPRVDRSGRSLAPQKKLAYWLLIASDDPKKLEVEVLEGNFITGAASSDMVPATVGAVLEAHAESNGTRVQTCSVELTNQLDRPLDLILRAHCTSPRDGVTLLTAELRPNASGSYPFRVLPTALGWNERVPAYAGLRIESVEIVDWSAREPGDANAAAELLLPAYRSWLRWEEGHPAFRGRFRYEEHNVYEKAPISASGAFAIDAQGQAVATAEGASSLQSIDRQMEGALRDLLRPSAEALAGANRFVRVAPREVRIDGPGVDPRLLNPGQDEIEGLSREEAALRSPRSSYPIFELENERIIHERNDGGGEGERWTTRALGRGYVVIERSSAGGARVESYAYDLLQDWPILLRHRVTSRDARGAILVDQLLVLDRWVIATDVQPVEKPIPTGPDAERLRAVWNRVYRYPDRPVALRARFAAANPGTDGIWCGERAISGTLSATGFRGFRSGRPSWEEIDVALAGERVAEQSQAIAFAFVDRLVMWKGRDPAALEEFDAMFRGAKVTWHEGEGRFAIEDCLVKEIRASGGHIASLTLRSDVTARYTWKEQDGRLLAAKIQTGEETITAQWKKVADGWYLPVKVEFQRVFGKTWGPETLELSAIAIEGH